MRPTRVVFLYDPGTNPTKYAIFTVRADQYAYFVRTISGRTTPEYIARFVIQSSTGLLELVASGREWIWEIPTKEATTAKFQAWMKKHRGWSRVDGWMK